MPKFIKKFFKSIGRSWFILSIVIILVIFFYNQEVAIWLTLILLILVSLSYIPSFSFKKKFIQAMRDYDVITDAEISKKLMRPLNYIREQMFILFKNQKRKKWLIILLNNRYIFYNFIAIQKFKEFYDQGYGEKQILENLQKELNIKTRAEVKAIEDTLIHLKRIKKREILEKTTPVSKL